MPVRLLILYFSGTGNTDCVARYLAEGLVGLSVDVTLVSVEQRPAATIDGFDVLVFGFPVYECDSPRFLRDYLRDLAPGRGRGVFVFCTKGAWAGNAVRRNLVRLEDRGYVSLGWGSVTMPGSDGLAFLGKDSWMARSALNKDFDSLRSADSLLRQMSPVLRSLARGEPVDSHRRRLPQSLGGLLFDVLWSWLYDVISERMRTRFWSDERCIGCGLCQRLCPSGTVCLNGNRPEFGDGCVLCMRCIHMCPAEAIQIGQGTVNKFRWRGPKAAFRPLKFRPPEQTVATDLARRRRDP